jgi:hypothetical protein
VKLLVNEIQETWLQITDTYDIFSEIETPIRAGSRSKFMPLTVS